MVSYKIRNKDSLTLDIKDYKDYSVTTEVVPLVLNKHNQVEVANDNDALVTKP